MPDSSNDLAEQLPLGTPVLAWSSTRDDAPRWTKTRSEPWQLGHGDVEGPARRGRESPGQERARLARPGGGPMTGPKPVELTDEERVAVFEGLAKIRNPAGATALLYAIELIKGAARQEALEEAARRIIADHGARDDQAESILRAFTAAGLNIVRRPEQVEPQTGPKAEKPHERVEELRRIVASVTKPTEYEETQP